VAWADAYLRTKWHLDPSSRLATTHSPENLMLLFPLLGTGRAAGSPSNTMSSGSRPTYIRSGSLIHPAVWPRHNGHGSKIRGVPFWGELGPHQTQYGRGRGLPPCQVSSWSIQPFGHNTPTLQTDRQVRTDNGPIA